MCHFRVVEHFAKFQKSLPNGYSTCMDSGKIEVRILVRPSAYSRYDIGLNFLGGHRGFARVLFKLWQATNHEFGSALRFVTGDGWRADRACPGRWSPACCRRCLISGGEVMLCLPYWGSPLTSHTSGCTVVAGQYNEYCTRLLNYSSPPSVPLTRRWI